MTRGTDSHGPKPYQQRTVSTRFLRVPAVDWPAVKNDVQRQFRATRGRGHAPQLWNVPTPTLVVAYTYRESSGHDAKLMVLERHWREPLGAISPESLAAEGFRDFADFRTSWVQRHKTRFRPTRATTVCQVRPLLPGDLEAHGAELVHQLYEEHLP